jgi:type VI secretion system Hcp family effector
MMRADQHFARYRRILNAVAAAACAQIALIFTSIADVTTKAFFEGVTTEPVFIDEMTHATTHAPGGICAHEVVMARQSDKSTPKLMEKACAGQAVTSVRVETRDEDASSIEYFRIKFNEVLISYFSTAGSPPADAPTESLSFNYGKVEYTYIKTDQTGRNGDATSSYWDEDAVMGGMIDLDTDGDGIPDSYEEEHNLLILDPDETADDDSDGLNNIEEYLAGTSASDSNSVLQVSGATSPLGGGSVGTVTFDSIPGRAYDLYGRPSVDGPETYLMSVTAADISTTQIVNLPGNLIFVVVKVRVE